MLNLSWTRVTRAVVGRRIGCAVLVLAALCASYQPALAVAEDSVEQPQADPSITAWDYYFRAWYRLHRRWHRIWRGHGPIQAKCGDGKLQSDEQCDDGNVDPSDGCDASCQLEDNPTTPGDDRPGFVLCASNADPNLTCSPEQRCCRSPENVCDTWAQDCQRPDVTVGWGDNCDGPEDCDDELTCVRGSKYGASCTPSNPKQGYPVLCHADTDCAFLPEAGCGSDGVCAKL
jgi:cysteine-rich repeat protein